MFLRLRAQSEVQPNLSAELEGYGDMHVKCIGGVWMWGALAIVGSGDVVLELGDLTGGTQRRAPCLIRGLELFAHARMLRFDRASAWKIERGADETDGWRDE